MTNTEIIEATLALTAKVYNITIGGNPKYQIIQEVLKQAAGASEAKVVERSAAQPLNKPVESPLTAGTYLPDAKSGSGAGIKVGDPNAPRP